MKVFILAFAVVSVPAFAQAVSPVDNDTTRKFELASTQNDEAALASLFSDKVKTSVTQQLGPNGPNRDEPGATGAVDALVRYRAVIAKVGKPSSVQCAPADGVSVFCQYQFDQPGRGMQSMIMFDGKKIGALMVMYGGIGL